MEEESDSRLGLYPRPWTQKAIKRELFDSTRRRKFELKVFKKVAEKF